VKDDTRVELLALPIVAVILGIVALVLFAATRGPWAWIVLGLGLVLLLAFIIRRVTKRHPHMWDEAPVDDTVPQHDDIAQRSRVATLGPARTQSRFGS
jgi:hypothetical protein